MSHSKLVRRAVPKDKDGVLDLLRVMHADIGQFPLNEEKLADAYETVAECGVMLVADIAGSVEGSVGLHVFQPWYTDAMVMQDMWFYIREGSRSLELFETMLWACHRYASAAQLPLVLGVWSYKQPKTKMRLFGAYMDQICAGYQFTPVGGQFMERMH